MPSKFLLKKNLELCAQINAEINSENYSKGGAKKLRTVGINQNGVDGIPCKSQLTINAGGNRQNNFG
jgi:hypothetical protein